MVFDFTSIHVGKISIDASLSEFFRSLKADDFRSIFSKPLIIFPTKIIPVRQFSLIGYIYWEEEKQHKENPIKTYNYFYLDHTTKSEKTLFKVHSIHQDRPAYSALSNLNDLSLAAS